MSIISSPAISVVIPVYNGEAYLRRTIGSLIAQSFTDFEVICVNDGSTDGSLGVLEDLARTDARVKVFSKPNGGDATKAIIHGLQFARGRYFMYSSQDDLFSTDLLEKSFSKGEQCDADAVVPDMEFYSDGNKPNQPVQAIRGIGGDRSRVLSGREAFVLALDWTIHGFVMWKMDIVRQVGFATYGLSSDEYTSRIFFFHCKKVVFSSGVFYYRQDNPGAITKKWNLNQLDYIETCRRLQLFAAQHDFAAAEVAVLDRVLLGHLIRVQLMFNANVNKLSASEIEKFDATMRSLYQRNSAGIRSMRAHGLGQRIKKIACSNYFLFRLFCRLLHLRQARAV